MVAEQAYAKKLTALRKVETESGFGLEGVGFPNAEMADVYKILDHRVRTAEEIAERLGMMGRTVGALLQKLEALNLAQKEILDPSTGRRIYCWKRAQ